jgi:hypothetical protein
MEESPAYIETLTDEMAKQIAEDHKADGFISF